MTETKVPSSKSVEVSIAMAGTVSLEGLDELMAYGVSVSFRPDGATMTFVKGDETRTHVFPIADMVRGAAWILGIARSSADANSARSYAPKPDPGPKPPHGEVIPS